MLELGKTLKSMDKARLLMLVFLAVLIVLMFSLGMPWQSLTSNFLTHIGMNAFMVLAMFMTIRTGTGLNYGLPLGLISGLLGGVLSLEWELSGLTGLLVAILVGAAFAALTGFLFGVILNHVKGNEMVVGNYIAFSFTYLMCIVWMFLPFSNSKLILVVNGFGLRSQVPIFEYYAGILDGFLRISLGGVEIPLGMMLIFALALALVWLLFRTRLGNGLTVAGSNPKFAKGLGINVNRAHIIGSMLSSILGAIGIIVYSQSYGYYMLYTAPMAMAFPAMAAILIGGASAKKVSISNVIFGICIYQGIITLAPNIAGTIFVGSNLSEPLRVVIQNGIILYALTKIGGGE